MPFPTPPGRRIAYDTDGTQVFIKKSLQNGGDIIEMNPAAVAALNTTVTGGAFLSASVLYNEYKAGVPSDSFIAFLFPVPMQLTGLFYVAYCGEEYSVYDASDIQPLYFETSTDTTNGVDGTWQALGTFAQGESLASGRPSGSGVPTISAVSGAPGTWLQRPVTPNYRLDASVSGAGFHSLTGPNLRNVLAIRSRNTWAGSSSQLSGQTEGAYVMHFYGVPDTGASDQRLDMFQVGADLPVPADFFDWQDVPLGSSADKSFRVKNVSATLSAQNIHLFFEDLAFYTTSVAAELFFSLDQVTWTSTLDIAELTASATSPTIYLRRSTPLNAPLSTWSPRIRVTVGSWA